MQSWSFANQTQPKKIFNYYYMKAINSGGRLWSFVVAWSASAWQSNYNMGAFQWHMGYEFQANSRSLVLSLTTRSSPSVIPATPIGNIPSILSILNIKAIVQSAISPLILELTALKEEIKQLKTPQNNASVKTNINKAKEIQQAPI